MEKKTEQSENLNQQNNLPSADDCAHLIQNRNGDGAIPVSCAKVWTDNWKKAYPQGPHSFLFTREEVLAILNEKNLTHVRVSFGINEAADQFSEDYFKLLLVGAEVKEENGEYVDEALIFGEDDTIQDFAKPCPPFCPTGVKKL